jgi:hypothetical protein
VSWAADTPITTDDVQWMVIGAVIAVLAVLVAMMLRDRVAERRAADRMERRLLAQLDEPPAPGAAAEVPPCPDCGHLRGPHRTDCRCFCHRVPVPARDPDWPLVRGCNCPHARAAHTAEGCQVTGCRCEGARV